MAERSRTRVVLKSIAIAVASLVGLVGVIALAGLPIYVNPPRDEVESSDLIYVIGPVNKFRIREEQRLRSEGVADQSLFSVPLTGFQSAGELASCADPTVTCIHPEPFTTKGEALALGAFVAEHELDGQVVVITRTAHVARTRYIFAKCYDGEVSVIGVDERLSRKEWAYEYAYQTAAFVKAWLTPCDDLSDI